MLVSYWQMVPTPIPSLKINLDRAHARQVLYHCVSPLVPGYYAVLIVCVLFEMSHFVAVASLKLSQKMYLSLPPSAGIAGVTTTSALLEKKMTGTGSHELGATVV